MAAVGQIAVTSFSPEGGRLYGRKMVRRFCHYWPVPLVVYTDVPAVFEGAPNRLTCDIPDWAALRAGWARDPLVHGCSHPSRPKQDKQYEFLWDAGRFAVKPFVIRDAAVRLRQGILIWLDADTLTFRSISEKFVPGLLRTADVAYLGRQKMYPETGFLAFRIPEALPLLEWCCDAYLSGRFRSLQRGWTDCHVFEAALKAVPIRANNITQGVTAKTSHIWDVSPLAQFMEHFKGRRSKVDTCE